MNAAHITRWWIAVSIAAAFCLPASTVAQTIYRCGSGHAANSYSQQPCANGGRLLPVDDARTDAERRAAQEGVDRDRRLAAALERDRRADANRPGPRAVALSAAPSRAAERTPRSARQIPKAKAAVRNASPSGSKKRVRTADAPGADGSGFDAVVPAPARKAQRGG